MRILVVLALLAAVAHADPDRKARANEAFLKGETAYKDGDYLGAIDHFKHAYDLDADPGYLFNIAQSYRFANNCVNAAEYYRRFLALVPDPPKAQKIRGWLADAERCASAAVKVEPAPPPPQTDAPGLGFDPPPPSLMQPEVPAPPRRETERDLRRPLGYVSLAVGLGALVLAGYSSYDAHQIGLDARASAATCTEAMPCSASELRAFDEPADQAQRRAAVGYVVGGAAIAGGVVLLLTARRAPSLAVAPTSRGAVIGANIRF